MRLESLPAPFVQQLLALDGEQWLTLISELHSLPLRTATVLADTAAAYPSLHAALLAGEDQALLDELRAQAEGYALDLAANTVLWQRQMPLALALLSAEDLPHPVWELHHQLADSLTMMTTLQAPQLREAQVLTLAPEHLEDLLGGEARRWLDSHRPSAPGQWLSDRVASVLREVVAWQARSADND